MSGDILEIMRERSSSTPTLVERPDDRPTTRVGDGSSLRYAPPRQRPRALTRPWPFEVNESVEHDEAPRESRITLMPQKPSFWHVHKRALGLALVLLVECTLLVFLVR